MLDIVNKKGISEEKLWEENNGLRESIVYM